ncbi:RNase H domain-containing protein [Trichonephila clavipes]|nr:RNase H domain-containing protein [Trichonephila clavipes]
MIQGLKRHSQFLVRTASGYYLTAVVPFNISLNWHKVDDNTEVAILEKLKHLSSSREIHLQWVPSHVNIAGNEIADSITKDGAAQHTMNSAALTYSEPHSTYINSKQTTVPPAHHWYEAKRPGGSLFLQCSRKEQTILTRFRSGHF